MSIPLRLMTAIPPNKINRPIRDMTVFTVIIALVPLAAATVHQLKIQSIIFRLAFTDGFSVFT